MKIKLCLLIFAFGAMTFLLLSGCTMTKVTYEDAPLTPVKFESAQASQTFYQAILAGYFPASNPSKGSEYSITLDLPSPIWIDHRTRPSYRTIVNAAVAQADANQDGLITEAEATAFASCCCCQPGKKGKSEERK